jgi:peroxiredoxin family protein
MMPIESSDTSGQIRAGEPTPSQAQAFEARIASLEKEVQRLRELTPRSDKVTLLVFSGELDRILAGLIIATTAASLDKEVTIFFTFWGINALKEKRVLENKGLMEKAIDLMTPTGASHMGLSQMNMLGAGAAMLKRMMKEKGVVSVDELLEIAKDSGVKLVACSMTMQVMGIRQEELTEHVEIGGAATYLEDASRSGITLFV